MKTDFRLKQFLGLLGKGALIFALTLTLFLGQAHSALAARGGRMGGFRAPSRSAPAPNYGGGSYGGGGYYGGGGMGFPFMLPFFFGGGGTMLSLLALMVVAGLLMRAFQGFGGGSSGGQSSGYGSGYSGGYDNPTVTVAKVQVGLLAQARSLQHDLDRIAQTADTSTNEGLAGMLQETVLSLLRHPEYWVYAATETQQSALDRAEPDFNRMTLMERSKLSAETLSNYNGQLRSASELPQLNGAGGALAQSQEPSEYIIVTIIVAAMSKFQLPKVDSADTLRQTLRQVGSMAGDQLLGTEVVWTPQAEGDVLTSDEVIAAYPELRAVG